MVLQYHHIDSATPRSTSISPERFQQHLDYLHAQNFRVLSLPEFIEHLQTKRPFADKTALITFDDGYISILNHAAPRLKAKGYPFTVFINIEPIQFNLSQFMDWSQLKALQRYGATIANHAYQHNKLIEQAFSGSDPEWQNDVEKQVTEAQQAIKQQLGEDLKVLAYPYGEFSPKLKSIIKGLGYIAFAQHSGAVDHEVDPQAIPRFAFGGDYGDPSDFASKVMALPLSLNFELIGANRQTLDSHILSQDENQPQLKLTLPEQLIELELTCFFSGQGQLDKKREGNSWIFTLKSPVSKGRSRFNCTAPSSRPSRYYWQSFPIIRP